MAKTNSSKDLLKKLDRLLNTGASKEDINKLVDCIKKTIKSKKKYKIKNTDIRTYGDVTTNQSINEAEFVPIEKEHIFVFCNNKKPYPIYIPKIAKLDVSYSSFDDMIDNALDNFDKKRTMFYVIVCKGSVPSNIKRKNVYIKSLESIKKQVTIMNNQSLDNKNFTNLISTYRYLMFICDESLDLMKTIFEISV